jgi:thiol-disulfide isomerase/thioredoxin
LIALVALVALVAGCSGGATTEPTPPATGGPANPSAAPATAPPASAMPSEDPDGSAEPSAEPSAAGVVVDRAWATAELIDVSTGESFRITDLVAQGKVVFVEPMAIWCTKCRAQQADAMTALAQLDRSKVVWLGLDVDPSETAEALADYGPRWGFDHTYAIAGTEVARALVDDFGSTVISPPSTPIVVVGTDGTVTLTDYGHKSVEQLVALATEHGA